MSHLEPSGRERSKRRSNRKRRQRSGMAMAMAMMLGSLLAVLLAISARRTHAAKLQQRRAAESMQLEQMRLAVLLRLHAAAKNNSGGDPIAMVEWDPAVLPLDVTDAGDRPDKITTGWRVVARFTEPGTSGQSTTRQPTVSDPVISDQFISDPEKRDVLVEVVSAHSRQRLTGQLDLGEDGESKGRSKEDRQRDPRNESEVP